MREFFVIIVTYNNEPCICDLLSDIKSSGSEILDRTIIVDNNSSDETRNCIQENFPQIKLIENKENIGYGRAVNQSVRLFDSEFFFLLNPDIRMPKDFFIGMLKGLSSGDFSAVGPLQFKLEDNEPRLNFCWSFWDSNCFRLYRSHI